MKTWPWWIWLLIALAAVYLYAQKRQNMPSANDPRWTLAKSNYLERLGTYYPPQGTMEIIDSSGMWWKLPDGTITRVSESGLN